MRRQFMKKLPRFAGSFFMASLRVEPRVLSPASKFAAVAGASLAH